MNTIAVKAEPVLNGIIFMRLGYTECDVMSLKTDWLGQASDKK